MKTPAPSKFACLLCAAAAVAVLTVAGCQTSPKLDWNNRVGSYTYDQAVGELGVPDKTAELTDGRKMAEWITHKRGGSAFGFGVGSYGSHTGVGVSQTVGTGGKTSGLRLTFDKDGKLAAWAKN